MTLDARDLSHQPSTTPEDEAMRQHARELHEWLLHLEGWVEKQLAATQALVELLAESRADGYATSRGGRKP